MANFPAASETENPHAHTEKTLSLRQSLSCSHFRGPISSAKWQTNFLGMPFKMIHPQFQSIFPISYWDLSLFVAEGWFSVHTASLLCSPWFAVVSFRPFWGRANGLKSVDDSRLLFTSFPENSTLLWTFPDNVFPLSQVRWLHWF